MRVSRKLPGTLDRLVITGTENELSATPTRRARRPSLARDALGDNVLCADHVGSGLPACSAMMYSAYQSAHCSSR